MKVNEYDLITLDNEIELAILLKKTINEKEYLLCQEVIGEELTLNFNIYELDDEELIEIDDKQELTAVYNEMIKDTAPLPEEQQNHLNKLLEIIND